MGRKAPSKEAARRKTIYTSVKKKDEVRDLNESLGNYMYRNDSSPSVQGPPHVTAKQSRSRNKSITKSKRNQDMLSNSFESDGSPSPYLKVMKCNVGDKSRFKHIKSKVSATRQPSPQGASPTRDATQSDTKRKISPIHKKERNFKSSNNTPSKTPISLVGFSSNKQKEEEAGSGSKGFYPYFSLRPIQQQTLKNLEINNKATGPDTTAVE